MKHGSSDDVERGQVVAVAVVTVVAVVVLGFIDIPRPGT